MRARAGPFLRNALQARGGGMTEEAAAKSLSLTKGDEFYTRYRRSLLRYFLRRVRSLADAEDLTHELFFRFLRRAQPEPTEPSGKYVFTAAGNLLRDRARRSEARPGDAPELRDPGAHLDRVADEFTPDRVLLGKELLAEVLASLDELPPRTRDIFLAFRVERMKHREIAKALGISASAVEKQIMRATAHLARRFPKVREGSISDET